MIQCCKYDKVADICDVVQGLGVDVCNAIETGVIQDTSATTFHNMMKDFAEIGPVVREPFDVIEYDRSYTKFRKYVKDEEDKKK